LNECSQRKSGEHPLSRALLELVDNELGETSTHVEVRNLSFQQPGVAESFGIASPECNILCDSHNSRLANYDAEIINAFTAFERLHYAAAGRQVVVQSAYVINADNLERFLLKALCGGLYAGLFPVPEVARIKKVEPPLGWLRILYQRETFPPGFGLYFAQASKDITADKTIIQWAPLLLGTEEYLTIHGLRFWLFGFEFTLLAPGPEPKAIESMREQMYRPASLTVQGASVRIQFAWRDGPKNRGIVFRRV